MEKLSDSQHVIMASFAYPKQVIHLGTRYNDAPVIELLEAGYIRRNTSDSRDFFITAKGVDYRRRFFPTKDEQIADLRAGLANIRTLAERKASGDAYQLSLLLVKIWQIATSSLKE